MKKSLLFLMMALAACGPKKTGRELLNVSYDPTREFYREFNDAFSREWQKSHPGEVIRFRQSHGGSGKQARSVIDGLEADVVTLALSSDVDTIAREGKLLPADWQKKLPHNSAPYTSTIVFVVRAGNPKGIKDWADLVAPGVAVITPNPKTSGGARWNYLAAWAYAQKRFAGNQEKARDFIRALYKNVVVLDTGARGATTSFTQRKLGDVLIAWENEAYLALKEFPNQLEIVLPSLSILAEPSVAAVESVARKKGNLELANAYLQYLYSDEGQQLAGKHYFRPRNGRIAAKFSHIRPLALVTIDAAFGGWEVANKTHFADGGIFDEIYGK
jgi:sulfate transport system substrate-binding protein